MAVREKRPRTGTGWVEAPVPTEVLRLPGKLAASAWRRGNVGVLSSLVLAELPGGKGAVGPQWHVSVGRRGKQRPREKELARALKAFDMVGAEEDNHHPGVARHFFLPVDPRFRGECECKETEDVVVEPDGYAWTNPREEGRCRGCELEGLTGAPCPIHSRGAAAEPFTEA